MHAGAQQDARRLPRRVRRTGAVGGQDPGDRTICRACVGGHWARGGYGRSPMQHRYKEHLETFDGIFRHVTLGVFATRTQVHNFKDVCYHTSPEGIAKITINRPEVHNAFRPLTTQVFFQNTRIRFVHHGRVACIPCQTRRHAQYRGRDSDRERTSVRRRESATSTQRQTHRCRASCRPSCT
jgi:hypothetical protein